MVTAGPATRSVGRKPPAGLELWGRGRPHMGVELLSSSPSTFLLTSHCGTQSARLRFEKVPEFQRSLIASAP